MPGFEFCAASGSDVFAVSSPDSAGDEAAVEGGVAIAGTAPKHVAMTPAWKACLTARRFEIFPVNMTDSLSIGSLIGIRLWLAADRWLAGDKELIW
jgi:hypothetical protein